MPNIITAAQLRSVLGVSSSLYDDNYLNDIYIEMVRQAMGGRDLEENENKIMRKIGRSCLIDKHF